ncbi:pentapeptide repeat-containing protein [Synechococcales cyanobacterium C]|uniref:Pentapeptide repeat-containing protein n=1 Tax=Petrachloros mirabilis ULC683 TaxID=2781853 RepID=A0A8K1ZZT7_9CYAN|nr:pentapeptide repeat-containing protein [Petrachloros mirabilis]NCJ07863.1 pentapeptide repeat-containing protein [Petrachloros mirabilis ULC683]
MRSTPRRRRWVYWSLVLGLALLWWLVAIPTALAKENTVNYTLTDLQHRNFSHQNLVGTSFAGADMRWANFQGANLQSTILTRGSFLEANLQDADLTDAFADRVFFNEANLTYANFTNAILTSSLFTDAVITGADFSGAILDRHQIAMMCEYAEGINPQTGVATRDSLGCR